MTAASAERLIEFLKIRAPAVLIEHEIELLHKRTGHLVWRYRRLRFKRWLKKRFWPA